MKHNIKIAIILLAMFIITQLIGLYVVNSYIDKDLPLGLQTPTGMSPVNVTSQIIISFVIAIFLLFFLTKFKAEIILKIWFLVVVIIALVISFTAILPKFDGFPIIPLIITLPLALIKIYGKNFLIHNITELFIYPGIASVFVPFLSQWNQIINISVITFILIIISGYDIWAVWHSGIMQKMAKYQINKLRVFSGFFIPYISKKVRLKLKKMKKSELKKKKIKINIAILGGGDVIFPIIVAGVMLKTFGLIAALFVIAGAMMGLSYLFFFSKKKKFYPAMPFITTGIFVGMILSYIIL